MFIPIFLVVFMAGCATAQPIDPYHPAARALGGAALGAAAGAAIGAVAGNPGKGAVIGSIVGGMAGALTGRHPSYQRGDVGYPRYDGDVESQCDSLYHQEEQEACRRGVQRAESGNTRRIRSACRQIGQNFGEAGAVVPNEAADRYEKEVYRQACRDGLQQGHAVGWQQRLRNIENNAARRSQSQY